MFDQFISNKPTTIVAKMIFPCKAIHAACTGNDIPRIAGLTHGLVKTCMKKRTFLKKMRFGAGQRSIIFPIHDAGDDGEPFPEIFIFFLVILSIADLLAFARLSEDIP